VETDIYDSYVAEIDKLIRRVSFVIKCRGRDILDEFNITIPQFNALLLLRENGDMTIGDLGSKMYLASSTATDLIDRMERDGLVVRERDSSDRRVVRLHMQEKGHQMIREVMENRKRYLSEILSHLSPDEKEALKQSLESLYVLMKPACKKQD
jgi:DNA-binding MarR family transcriptional regulator